MVVRTVAGAPAGEDLDDLRSFLTTLRGAPEVHETVVLTCPHHDEPATWTYVDADPAVGVARRRCLACGTGAYLLDSEARWTYPQAHACRGCRTSIFEVAAGLHQPDGEHVEWVAVAARCVECGRLQGLTDVVLPALPHDEVVAGL